MRFRSSAFFFLGFVFLLQSIVSAQVKYEPTPAGIRRAIVAGKLKEALASYEAQGREAEENANASSSPKKFWQLSVHAYSEASRAARLMGNHQKALIYAEKALTNAEKTGNPALQLRALNQNIRVQRRIANFEKVEELIRFGFVLANQVTNPGRRLYWEANVNNHLGKEMIRKKDYRNAIAAHSKALKAQEAYLTQLMNEPETNRRVLEGTKGNSVYTLYWLSEAYRLAGELERAVEHIEMAFKRTEQWKVVHSFQINLYSALGEIYLEKKDITRSLENFRRALTAYERQQRSAPLLSPATRLGDVLFEEGKPVEALTYYRKAITEIESARSLLRTGQLKQSFFESSLDPYVGAIRSLWSTEQFEEAFNYSERVRARVFLDSLGNKVRFSRTTADVQKAREALSESIFGLSETDDSEARASERGEDLERNYSALVARARERNREHASLISVEPLKLKDVQSLLDSEQTLVEFFVTSKKTFVWVVQASQIKAVALPVSQEELVRAVNGIRTSIAEFQTLSDYRLRGRDLFNVLVQALLPHIRGKELIIVPHGILHYLPFHALVSPDGRYLIEDYAISYLSSASLLQFTKAKTQTQGNRVIAFGNPDLGDRAKNLDFAQLEIDAIRASFPDAAVFTGKQATEEKSKNLMPQYHVLHFAAHAELDEKDPVSSKILLVPNGGDDGQLKVSEIFEMELNARLVVLSGCETGLGKLSGGDELVGLTRAFIYAGTPSVVASLWKVDDAATARLMSSFYNHLKSVPTIQALRQAQLEMIRGKATEDMLARRGVGGIGNLSEPPESQFLLPASVPRSHPYFWAPFILVGEGT